MIVRRGAGVLLQSASDVVPVVRRMLDDSKYYATLRSGTVGIAIPNATRYIVEEITALLPSPLVGAGEPPAEQQIA